MAARQSWAGWTVGEEERLRWLHADGKSRADIAKTLGRSIKSVSGRIDLLGLGHKQHRTNECESVHETAGIVQSAMRNRVAIERVWACLAI